MKRFLLHSLSLFLLFMTSATVYAQQQSSDFSTTRVIKGAVIDKNGNPLPGATVSATGGAETVTTDADGSYTIEVPFWLKSLTASYPGCKDKKINLTNSDQPIFTLKPYKPTYGFVNVMFANVWHIHQEKRNLVKPVQQFGVMGGAYQNWGGYGKVLVGIIGGGKSSDGNDMVRNEPTVTGGAIKYLNNNFNFFFGAGLAWNYGVHYSGNNISVENWDEHGGFSPSIEFGIMSNFKKMNAVMGITYVAPTWNSYQTNSGNMSIFIGVGIRI